MAPAISRGLNVYEVIEDDHPINYSITQREEEGEITINIQFEPGVNTFNYTVENNIDFNSISIENISSYSLMVNAAPVSIPPGFEVEYGDTLGISISKSDLGSSAYITLTGKLI